MKTHWNRLLAATSAAALLSGFAQSASHSDAPLMVLDPAANITDVYAFVGRNAQGVKVLNLVMNVNPLEDPGNGVIYDRFADDVRYNIHIARGIQRSSGVAFDGLSDLTFRVNFQNSYKNLNTILSYGLGTEAGPIMQTGDARQNFLQTYSITLEEGPHSRVLGRNLMVPPVNVGPRTTPGYYDSSGNRLMGATAFAELPSYVQQTIHSLPNGIRAFAGQREDGFYADTPGIFDFIGVRSPGKDGFSGYNVHTIALQVPVSEILGNQDIPIVGVWATTERQSVTVRPWNGSGPSSQGRWTQVSRMGNPLFNEVLVALADKDRYNMTSPDRDRGIFKKYALRNEAAFLLNAVLGTNFVVEGRTDLESIFIPDLLRVDLSTEAVPLAGSGSFNRLSFIGGDTLASPFAGTNVPSGWPNGRRFGDDVVDIALTAIASGPSYSSIVSVGDNVNANDTLYDRVFPYAGTPWGGPGTTLHP